MNEHISRRFNQDIEDLRSNVLAMGGLVEAQLSRALAAVVSGDSELGLQVANDVYKVNDLEVSIDEQCGRILAIHRQSITFMMENPRSIKRVMNVTWAARSLERIGDHAKNICKYVIYMVHGRDSRHTLAPHASAAVND